MTTTTTTAPTTTAPETTPRGAVLPLTSIEAQAEEDRKPGQGLALVPTPSGWRLVRLLGHFTDHEEAAAALYRTAGWAPS